MASPNIPLQMQNALENAAVLRGLLIMADELGIPAVADEERVFAMTALLSEARIRATALSNSLEHIAANYIQGSCVRPRGDGEIS